MIFHEISPTSVSACKLEMNCRGMHQVRKKSKWTYAVEDMHLVDKWKNVHIRLHARNFSNNIDVNIITRKFIIYISEVVNNVPFYSDGNAI
jgi:hypothetical protein